MAITISLFVYAVIRHGLTDDLLLETGIFLVSVKIIMLSYENGQHIRNIESKRRSVDRESAVNGASRSSSRTLRGWASRSPSKTGSVMRVVPDIGVTVQRGGATSAPAKDP